MTPEQRIAYAKIKAEIKDAMARTKRREAVVVGRIALLFAAGYILIMWCAHLIFA